MSTLELYIPRLDDDAFVDLPQGVVLEGSPTEYRFQLFAMPPLGHFEREEAVGRIFLGLDGHGKWAAVRVRAIGTSIEAELTLRREQPDAFNYPHSFLTIGQYNGPRIGIDECIELGWLGTGIDDQDNWIVWPTPALLEVMKVYRTNV